MANYQLLNRITYNRGTGLDMTVQGGVNLSS